MEKTKNSEKADNIDNIISNNNNINNDPIIKIAASKIISFSHEISKTCSQIIKSINTFKEIENEITGMNGDKKHRIPAALIPRDPDDLL